MEDKQIAEKGAADDEAKVVGVGQQHANFGKGKHSVNPDAVNHRLRREMWEG